MKKKVAIIGLIILILAYIVFSAIIYAGNQVVYVGLNTAFSNGDGYGIGDPTDGGIGIWNLRNYDSTDRSSESSKQRELYCLKGQYGDTWNTNAKTIIEYDLPYNLQTEREKVLELLEDSGANTANDVVTEILDDSNAGAYKQLLWVMDNLFIPGKSDKDKLLEKIGILYDEDYDVYYYEPVEGYDYSDKVNELEYYYTLTETDIKAVQQAVIWYYTNAVIDGNTAYDNTDAIDWLTLTMDNGGTYNQLFDYNRATTGEGPARYEQAHILFNYLIDSAEKNTSNYTSDGYLKPVEINISGLTTDTNNRYQIEANRNATNYIYGPITINKNNDLDYNIILNVSDLSGTSISSSNYTFTNSTGAVIANDVNALVGRDEGFYISIPKTVAKGINIDISVSYNTKTKTLWLSEKESGITSITVNAEQPVLEIEETTNTETVKFTSIPKEFDLALRKYITAVNGTTVTDTRVPNIDLSTLQSGTTATYKHRKDPVVIKNGDIVTYKITVYNEGEKNGYASEIIDQLPDGLKYADGLTIGSNKNTYSVTYNETTNRVVFTNTTKAVLNKYGTNSLDSETLEFTCKVTATPDTENDKILTNVAWISGAYDSESDIEITDVGDDRDSRPQTYPSVSSTEIEGFKGNSNNKTDLTDSTYHYAGEQDDDDFEKLVLEPEIQITVTKAWEDNNDQDGLRPEEVSVSLYANEVAVEGKSVTLSDENNWTYTFTNLPLKNNGTAITYSVKETTGITGYSIATYGSVEEGFTITNTHVPTTVDIWVQKNWEDANNQDGIRATSITVNLLANGTAVQGKKATLNESNSWKYTFTDLPEYQDGSKITYTISEPSVPEGYESQIAGDAASGFTITNTHTPETIDIPVTKVWEDGNNQDGLRPNEITVSLKNGDTTVDTVTLNEANTWKHTFTDLPKNSNGTEIEYTVVEEGVPEDYTSETAGDMKTGYIITNTYEVEKISVSVTKEWDDENDQDGIRPTSIDVNLKNGATIVDTITLNEENNWTYTFTDLPKKSKGTEIEYTVAEEDIPEGYTTATIGDMETGYTITNTHVPETINIPVTKVWEDNNNQDGKRPTEITITLYANNQEVDGKSIKLNESNSWKYTYTDLPKNQNGTEISYTVEETGVTQGYSSKTEGSMEEGYTITNTYIPETINIPVTKVWNDSNNQDGLRPEEITVQLYANETEIDGQEITLNESNSWKYTFEDLPKYQDGESITYTVQETGIPTGYSSLTSGSMNTGYTITNTYTPETTSVKVTKVWEDNNNQDGIRPTSVNVSLLANDEVVETIDLSESNNWQHTFTDLPTKQNGEDVVYTVTENTEIEGYTTQITNNNVIAAAGEIQTVSAPEYTITNTHETEEINITVTKVWNDENNYDKIRPESITVNIKNGETVVETVTLNADNNWIYTFENLPAKQNGETISYVIEEIEPEGYTADITEDENEENKYIITNTHIPEKPFDLALRKYIIKVNNNELTTLGLSTRVPNISTETLEEEKTANYRHRKDPVKVEEGDIVTYAITIYNEGEKAGYASQIIDQLPSGLIYNPSGSITSKDSTGADKNTYTVDYESTTNKVIFDIVNTAENPAKELQPYEDELDCETIEIKCKVVYRAVAGKENILTNVAWINKAFDVEDDKEITSNVGDDRDSEPNTKPNVSKDKIEDYKGNEDNNEDLTDDTYNYKGEQDDDDFEKIYVKTNDLSLRKYIDKVNGNELEESREPVVNVSPLQNGEGTTAIYKHPKTPVSLKVGDTVLYTIRIYNEGETAGYANEVKDYLPPYLEYLENSEINKQYGWKISEDGRVATTTYLSNKKIEEFNGIELDYEDLQIECKVSSSAIPDERITNIAEITEYKFGDTKVEKDIDSESGSEEENLPEDNELPNYKKEQENDEYVPGNEDDDDFEKIYVKEFDLALRKFITKVQDREITAREPKVKNKNGVISYEHTKEPLIVHVGDVVIYTLRIYNEGEIDGYASEITDDIPEYLEYLPSDSTNVEYMWKMYDANGKETENVEEAAKIKTEYLSKENGKNNLIEAFDGKTLYYRDIKIAFKVKDPDSNEYIITNYAQISDDADEDGNEIKDKDSTTDEWNEGEDDQDIENVKVEYFDLSLVKFVSKVIIIEDGKETITETGYNGHENPEPVVKVELHKKKLSDVVVKFGYGITITNEGDMPGYATKITDYIPEGLKLDSTDNPEWMDEGNNVISTRQLEGTLLQPGESATVEVMLTWINGADNLALKTNTAEISEDDNTYDVPDKDSTPDNKQEGEDDIDIAKVILAVSTGATKTYFTLTLGLLGVVLVGIVLIKKYVI